MNRLNRLIALSTAAVVTWGGILLCAALGTVSLTDLTQTYDGSPKEPGYAAPEGVVPSFVFAAATAEAPILFRRFPDELALSYPSLGYAALKFAGVGELLRFEDPGNRLVAEVEVVLVTWAKAGDYPELSVLNPEGYTHPISVDLYSVGENNSLTHIESVEEDILVPWRPLTTPDGSDYPSNGFAFRALIRLPEPVAVPERTMVMISFNTQNSGFEPVGEPGPYNQLNLGLNRTPITHGTDDDPSAVLRVEKSGDGFLWGYPYTGYSFFGGPMLTVRGPRPQLPGPPVDAGEYLVKAVFDLDEGLTGLTEPFTVLPAPAEILFGSTEVVVDGTPKPIEAVTNPEGLAVEVTYNGVAEPPSVPGTYAIEGRILSPNHTGEAETSYRLGYDYPSWLAATAPTLPIGETGPGDDPDGDGWSNFWEYAFQLNPAVADQNATPGLARTIDGLRYRFRRNPHALDLAFVVETNPQLSGAWVPAPGQIEASQELPWVSIPASTDDPRRFFRLAVEQQSPPPALSQQ